MGVAASAGKDNDELVDNLINGGSIMNENVEHIMRFKCSYILVQAKSFKLRIVDRGIFLPEQERSNAYKVEKLHFFFTDL